MFIFLGFIDPLHCLAVAQQFQLNRTQALEIAQQQKQVIEQHWHAVCDEAELSDIDKKLLWRRQFLNPFSFMEST